MPVDALVYPRFSGVPTFMRLPHIPRAADLDLALIGIPFDGGTTYRPGARFGPRNIRVQSAMIRPWNPVLKTNPFEKWRIGDFGDLSINPLSIEDTYRRVTEQLGDVFRDGARSVCVGGDHSILLPILVGHLSYPVKRVVDRGGGLAQSIDGLHRISCGIVDRFQSSLEAGPIRIDLLGPAV